MGKAKGICVKICCFIICVFLVLKQECTHISAKEKNNQTHDSVRIAMHSLVCSEFSRHFKTCRVLLSPAVGTNSWPTVEIALSYSNCKHLYTLPPALLDKPCTREPGGQQIARAIGQVPLKTRWRFGMLGHIAPLFENTGANPDLFKS